ncbi:MAG TPA: glycosyltransferase [Chloroflexia bacterium]|nr:glycosyltransferase [Chloroflexia bacterium]
MLGTRGVPSVYGGFETCAEQLGVRLVERGHEVTVYSRPHFVDPNLKQHRGIRLVSIPTVRNKYLDTLVHVFLSSLHALGRRYDVCLYFIAGNSVVAWIPRLVGTRTVINVDGLDWRRAKWPGPAKRYLQAAERLAPRLANAALTDSRFVQRFYAECYGARIAYIAYGSDVEPVPPGAALEKWELEPRGYILFVGRLVPENHPDHLLDAFRSLADTRGMKLVLMGDASYADDYVRRVKGYAAEDVVFTGYVYGEGYRELASNAYAFVLTSSASGTHPALLEAMGMGNCVVVNDTPENLEAMGGAGLSYRGGEGAASLAPVLEMLLERPDVVEAYRHRAREHVRRHYSWDAITEQYLALFHRVLSGRKRKQRR